MNDSLKSEPSMTVFDPDASALVNGIKEILGGLLGERHLTMETDLFELGLDSMARLELLAIIEERFTVELTEDMTQEFRTITRISRVIRNALLPAGV